jgi:hypothetical protein
MAELGKPYVVVELNQCSILNHLLAESDDQRMLRFGRSLPGEYCGEVAV